MWEDFTDFELAKIAADYGLEESIVFTPDLSLANRAELEHLLTECEFGLYFNSEVTYN